MKLSRTTIIALIACLFIIACSKQENKPATMPSKADSTKTESIKKDSVKKEVIVNIERMEKPVPFTQKNFKGFTAVYKEKFVLNLRKALNDLSKSNWKSKFIGEGFFDVAKIKFDAANKPIGIDYSFYNSKIIVLSVSGHIGGGHEITFMFEGKKDIAYSAWMYPLDDNEAKNEMRTLETKDWSKEDIENLYFNYSEYLKRPGISL
ncbi:MAG: hypothetical protein NT007_17995 [Candidatus Kapabacteria bacterium]|nr:hypothetical protein [Candidatus Kapabacteria bacterium]